MGSERLHMMEFVGKYVCVTARERGREKVCRGQSVVMRYNECMPKVPT